MAFHHLFHHAADIAELADAGGLDDDAVGSKLLQYLLESLAKITYQRAADAAGVHFGDSNTGILAPNGCC